MTSPLRLHKTLASLALAMTATAVGLHWMDPSARAGRSAYTAEELVSLSNDAVFDTVAIQAGIWRDVEITMDEAVTGRGIALTASRDRRQCHFFIDSSGRPTRENDWSSQKPWAGAPHTIRIHLERATDDGPNPAQWFAARSIILALDKALTARGKIPIHSAAFDPNRIIYSSSL